MRKRLWEPELSKNIFFFNSPLCHSITKFWYFLLLSKKFAVWARWKMWKVGLIERVELNRLLRTMSSLNLSTAEKENKEVSFWKCKSSFGPTPEKTWPSFSFLNHSPTLGSSCKILPPAWLNICVRHWWKISVYFKEKNLHMWIRYPQYFENTGKLKITHILPVSSHIA